MSTWLQAEAEQAFSRATRARRRARALCRLRRRGCDCCEQLPVADGAGARRGRRGVHEIPLEQIMFTLEPNRAEHFDPAFRPWPATRSRWLRVWQAEARGAVLPPISVRGAVTIDAVVTSD